MTLAHSSFKGAINLSPMLINIPIFVLFIFDNIIRLYFDEIKYILPTLDLKHISLERSFVQSYFEVVTLFRKQF